VKPEKDRKMAPEFDLKDAMGRTVKLSDYKGKIVLLNFWATWCGPCKLEIPWFIEFEQTYKDKGFAVLGVSMDEEGWEIVRPYIEKAKINYRMVIGNDSVATLYGGVDSLPTSFVIDKEGRIAAIHVGLVSKSSYQNDINQLLGSANKAAAGFGRVPLAFGLGSIQ
jgi:cytochrome c biogenesis protein CcmG/thiol:disulfide interchange protein DsbE